MVSPCVTIDTEDCGMFAIAAVACIPRALFLIRYFYKLFLLRLIDRFKLAVNES